ncbi:MAG: hypothetical protein ABIF71_03285 [Planctomycetota bacterium]
MGWIERFLRLPADDAEDSLRRIFLAAAIAIAIPVLLVFGVLDVTGGGIKITTAGIIDFVFAGFLALALVVLNMLHRGDWVFRIVLAGFIAQLAYNTACGHDAGATLLWAYLLPALAYFLRGRIEGTGWVGAGFSVVAGLVWLPGAFGTYPYAAGVQVRFTATFIMVTVFTFLFELLRERSHRALERKSADLEQALRDVNTLAGLLPICAQCKKVRDDKGYWNQIEQYLGAHAGTRFTHGLCPDCIRTLYPDMARQRDTDRPARSTFP